MNVSVKTTTTKESPMTTQTQALADHLKAAGWVEHYTQQLAGAERILASRRANGGSLFGIAEGLAMVQDARADIAYWQRRLDAIECPEA
ncbi:hypothetical protein BH23CHL8_BH23CHL8_31900 [soil metagenome]